MRKLTLTATAAACLLCGAFALTGSQADAQGAPPPPAADRPMPPMDGMRPGMDRPGMDRPGMDRPGMDRPGMDRPGMDRPGMHGMQGMHGMREGRMGGWMGRLRQFALIYPAEDRNLSGPDVQKIAEAFLLYNGNHSWKVTEVTEEAGRVTFALATPDGTAIAHFAMDRHTGRPERLN